MLRRVTGRVAISAIVLFAALAISGTIGTADADGGWQGPFEPNAVPLNVCSSGDHPVGEVLWFTKYPGGGRITNVTLGKGDIIENATGESLGSFSLLQTSIRAKSNLPWTLIFNVTVTCDGQGMVINYKAGFTWDKHGILHEHAIPGSPPPS